MADWHEIQRIIKLNSGSFSLSQLFHFGLWQNQDYSSNSSTHRIWSTVIVIKNIYIKKRGGGTGIFYVLCIVQIYPHWVIKQTLATWRLTRMKTTWSDMLKVIVDSSYMISILLVLSTGDRGAKHWPYELSLIQVTWQRCKTLTIIWTVTNHFIYKVFEGLVPTMLPSQFLTRHKPGHHITISG